jgi:hypothetical protein
MRREDGLGFSQDKFGSRIAVLQRRSQSYRFASAIFFAALHESGNDVVDGARSRRRIAVR